MAESCYISVAYRAATKSTAQSKHGAVLVSGGKILSVASNTVAHHAEIHAMARYVQSRERSYCEKEA